MYFKAQRILREFVEDVMIHRFPSQDKQFKQSSGFKPYLIIVTRSGSSEVYGNSAVVLFQI